MNASWWQLPGPARFLAATIRSLREGKSVVLCLPKHSPDPLPALRLSLESEWPVTTIRPEAELHGESPLDVLFEQFASERPASDLRTVAGLAEEDPFRGRLVFIDDPPMESWPAWRAFLTEYEHVSRSLSALDRTLFCVRLTGEGVMSPPAVDVCLEVQRYDCVRLIDSVLYAWLLLEDTSLSPLKQRVAASAIAALALWDPSLAERLAEQPFDQILQPLPILRDLAKERGWEPMDASSEEQLWCRGIKCGFDGSCRLHSAALAVSGTPADLERRLWSAQVGVLLPYIEERRQEIVEDLGPVLTVPFQKENGEVVDNLRDLEIGHIEWQLRNVPRVDRRKLNLISTLRRIRNHLSHLELVPADLVQLPESARWGRS